jgi:membrane-associated HD superfamily phosphohydrolase
MDFGKINYFAVLTAAISTFVLGGLWYSPLLFGKAWMRTNNFTDEDLKTFSKARMFGWSFIFSLVMALNLAVFLGGHETTVPWGMTAGVLAGLGWVAMAIGVIGVFENRSWVHILINGGYMTIAFTLMGAILGAWR